jgi:GTPase Era involved in 16S rRNA processing
MPENILNNVAAVCLKKAITVTKKDIVNEYKANQAVYDNLPKQNTTDEQLPVNDKPNAATTAMEEQRKPVEKVSYRYEMDTINGKPQRVLIKETRAYEQ